jgi:hypothetical protein
MPATKKRFGKKKDSAPIPETSFSVDFSRDGKEEEHFFVARPQLAYGDMVGLKRHEQDEDGKVLPVLDRIIRRAMRNDDGTPVNWKPVVQDGEFTAPDGKLVPANDLPKYTAHEAGSSRKRWIELIESDDAVVEFEQVMALFEHLCAVSSDRPTERPQRS